MRERPGGHGRSTYCRYSDWVPTLLRQGGFTFRFRSSDWREPAHVHVRGQGGQAGVWIEPEVVLEWSHGYNRPRIQRILKIAREHREKFLAAWRKHFGA